MDGARVHPARGSGWFRCGRQLGHPRLGSLALAAVAGRAGLSRVRFCLILLAQRKKRVNDPAPRMSARYAPNAMRGLALVALVVFLAVPVYADAAVARTGVLLGVVTRGPDCSPGGLTPCGEPLAGVTIVFSRHGHSVA